MVSIMEEEAASVVCHCSDGWDRTSQTTSLVKLMMDPYYRTRRGFAILVEQEWLSFGHKFGERYGQGEGNYTNEQRAPVFVQWLDCVFQLWRQFPASFEFSEDFLIALSDHVYSCRFGTFLVDTEAQAKALQLADRTMSVWTFLCGMETVTDGEQGSVRGTSPEAEIAVIGRPSLPSQASDGRTAPRHPFVNAAFRPKTLPHSLHIPLAPLIPNVSPSRVVLWERQYLRRRSDQWM